MVRWVNFEFFIGTEKGREVDSWNFWNESDVWEDGCYCVCFICQNSAAMVDVDYFAMLSFGEVILFCSLTNLDDAGEWLAK